MGTYNYGTNPLIDNHGMMYEGPLPQNSNESTWTLIDMPADRVGGGNVINTIPHSTMGNLVVGNYERVYIERGNEVHEVGAFIYDINNPGEHQYRELRLEPYKLITAYGIWQNGNDTTSYTIAGGMLDASGFNVGFLVDYNSETRNTNNLRPFVYDNMNRNFITHFEGITNLEIGTPESAPRYHSLAATGDENLKNGGAAFAVVERLLPSGVFGDAKWQPFQVGNSFTTGNTVLTNNLFGVYETANSTSKGIQSYWVGDL